MDYSALHETSSEVLKKLLRDVGSSKSASVSTFPELDDISDSVTYPDTPVSTETTPGNAEYSRRYDDTKTNSLSELDVDEFHQRLRIYDDILSKEGPSKRIPHSIPLSNKEQREHFLNLQPQSREKYEAATHETSATADVQVSRNRLNLRAAGPPFSQAKGHTSHKSRLPRLVPIESSSEFQRLHTPHAHEQPVKDSACSPIEELSPEDWDNLRDICSYLDSYINEEITAESSLNLEEARKASTALGLREPQGAMLEILLRIGLVISKYSETNAPWTYALQAFELELNADRHAEHLENRRRDQDSLATVISKHRTLKKYYKAWLASFETDVKASQKLLHAWDTRWLFPDYFVTWRRRAQMARKIEFYSQRVYEKTIFSNTLPVLLHEYSRRKAAYAESERFNRDLSMRNLFQLWRTKTEGINTLEASADRISRRIAQQRIVSLWSLRQHERCALKAVQISSQRGVLSLLTKRYRKLQNDESRVRDLRRMHVFKSWKNKHVSVTGFCEQSFGKARRLVAFRLLWGYLVYWRRETQVCSKQTVAEERLMRSFLAQLKAEAILNRLQSRRRRALWQKYLRYWYSRTQFSKKRTLETQAMCLVQSESVKKAAYYLILRALFKSTQRTALATETRGLLSRRGAFRMFRHGTSRHADQLNSAATLRDSLLKRRTLKVVTQASASLRDARLSAAYAEVTRRLDSRSMLHIFTTWRQTTQSFRITLDTLVKIRKHSILACLIDDWRSLLDDVNDMEKTSAEKLAARLQSASLRIWRQSLEEVRELADASEDLNIGRLAHAFRHGLRKWHRSSLVYASNSLQAARHHEQRIKSAELVLLQRWRDQLLNEETSDQYKSALGSTNLYSPDEHSSHGPSSRQYYANRVQTPRKLLAMSPRALQKWKTGDTEATNPPGASTSFLPLERAHRQSTGSPGDRSLFKSRGVPTLTPTKPLRNSDF